MKTRLVDRDIVTVNPEICIVHLLEVPQQIPVLVDWFIAEWESWYGAEGSGNAEQDLAACCDRDRIPLCLVALDTNDELLGTAALRAESVGSKLGDGPWLTGFLVEPEHRRKGIGTALVAAIEAETGRLGFDAVYVSTDTAGYLFERRCWQAAGPASSLRGPVTVYCRSLKSAVPNSSQTGDG